MIDKVKRGRSREKARITTCFFIPALFYTLFLFTNPLYTSTDSLTVAIVADGLYGSNNFCQYIHPLLCVIIKPLSRLFPTADVFTTILHLAVFYQLGLITYLGFERLPTGSFCSWLLQDYFTLLLTIMIDAFLSAGIVVWNVNYTIQTAAFVFTGVTILFLAVEHKKTCFWTASGTALLIFGFMLRIESALLFLPFIGLELVVMIIEKRRDWKKLIPAVLTVAILLISRTVFFSTEPYKTASRYNTARTTCVDYPMENWTVLEDIDFSKEDYRAAKNWGLADTEVMTVDLLESIAKSGAKNEFSFDTAGIQSVLKEMWRRVLRTNLYMLMMLVLTVVLTVRNLLLCGSRWRKLESVLAILGGFIILVYFTFIGRAPMRVWLPVIFAADFVLICAAVNSGTKRLTADIISQLLICIVLWFSVGQIMANNKWHEPQSVLTARVNADDSVYDNTFEGLYIWPNWHATIPEYFCAIGKLPTVRVLEHNLPL